MKERMLAAIFEKEGTLALKDVPTPKLRGGDDVLLKVEAAGICGSDVSILAVPPKHPATLGSILGHEFVGKVVEVVSQVSHVAEGDTVVVAPNLSCGHCQYCRRGMPDMCENSTTLGIFLDGGFAEYCRLPSQAAYRISDEVAPEQAALTEPLSCVVNAMNRLGVKTGEAVVVLGAGPMGLLFVQMLKLAGAGRIIVAEVSKSRIEKAYESGATKVVNPQIEDLPSIVQKETGIGADTVIDVVGTLFVQSLVLVRKGGRIILFGISQDFLAPIRQFDVTHNSITVMGSFIERFNYPSTIGLVESGALGLAKLITHHLPLKEIHKGIDLMRRGECLKVVVSPT